MKPAPKLIKVLDFESRDGFPPFSVTTGVEPGFCMVGNIPVGGITRAEITSKGAAVALHMEQKNRRKDKDAIFVLPKTLEDGRSLGLIKVHPDCLGYFTISGAKEVFQIVLPNEDGDFPWTPDTDQAFWAEQPTMN